MGLKNYIVGFIATGILVLLVFTFAYDLQVANGVQNTILSDNRTSSLKGDIQTHLTSFYSDSEEVKDIYYNTTLKEGTDSLYVPSQNTIQTKSWKRPFLIIQSSMAYAYTEIVGDRRQEFSYIFNAIIGVIVITGIFFFIKYIRQGQE